MKEHFKKIARLPQPEQVHDDSYDQQAAEFIARVMAGQEKCKRPKIRIPASIYADAMYEANKRGLTFQVYDLSMRLRAMDQPTGDD